MAEGAKRGRIGYTKKPLIDLAAQKLKEYQEFVIKLEKPFKNKRIHLCYYLKSLIKKIEYDKEVKSKIEVEGRANILISVFQNKVPEQIEIDKITSEWGVDKSVVELFVKDTYNYKGYCHMHKQVEKVYSLIRRLDDPDTPHEKLREIIDKLADEITDWPGWDHWLYNQDFLILIIDVIKDIEKDSKKCSRCGEIIVEKVCKICEMKRKYDEERENYKSEILQEFGDFKVDFS